MTTKVLTHPVNVERKFELLNQWNMSEQRKKEVIQFFKDYSSGKVTKRIGTNNPASLERNLCSLKPALENLKSFNKHDLQKFLEDLIRVIVQFARCDAYPSHLAYPGRNTITEANF